MSTDEQAKLLAEIRESLKAIDERDAKDSVTRKALLEKTMVILQEYSAGVAEYQKRAASNIKTWICVLVALTCLIAMFLYAIWERLGELRR